jgi:hypothetical protein
VDFTQFDHVPVENEEHEEATVKPSAATTIDSELKWD